MNVGFGWWLEVMPWLEDPLEKGREYFYSITEI